MTVQPTHDPEHVDRVAAALYSAMRPYWREFDGQDVPAWAEMDDEPSREMWRTLARAALDAVGEVTP